MPILNEDAERRLSMSSSLIIFNPFRNPYIFLPLVPWQDDPIIMAEFKLKPYRPSEPFSGLGQRHGPAVIVRSFESARRIPWDTR